MGNITDKNTKELECAADFDTLILSDMLDQQFSDEFDKLILSKGYTTQYIVNNCHISKTYLNELRRRTPDGKTKQISREKLLEVCLTLNADRSEIDAILKCASFRPLYARNKADSYILWGLLHNMNGTDIKMGLYERKLWHDEA